MTTQQLRAELESERTARQAAEMAHVNQTAKVNAAVRLCERYAHPGVNPGAHALAAKVLEVLK